VLFDSHDKDVWGLTSLVLDRLDQFVDGFVSSSDPIQVIWGVHNLSLDVLSVSDGISPDVAVGVGDLVQVTKGLSVIVLLSVVWDSEGFDFIVDGCSEISEDLHDAINGVVGFVGQREHVVHFSVELIFILQSVIGKD